MEQPDAPFGQPRGEPLYARVDKRKPNGYNNHALSLERLDDRGDYSYQSGLPADDSAGVDSWV